MVKVAITGHGKTSNNIRNMIDNIDKIHYIDGKKLLRLLGISEDTNIKSDDIQNKLSEIGKDELERIISECIVDKNNLIVETPHLILDMPKQSEFIEYDRGFERTREDILRDIKHCKNGLQLKHLYRELNGSYKHH